MTNDLSHAMGSEGLEKLYETCVDTSISLPLNWCFVCFPCPSTMNMELITVCRHLDWPNA